MTLLTLIQRATDHIGIPRPSSVINSTDQQVRQLLALANEEGEELARRHAWRRLIVDTTFTSVAAETQPNAIPADFDRFVNETFFNRTQMRELVGPLTDEEWQRYKATTAPVVLDGFRTIGGDLQLLPAPPAGQTYAYSYVSRNWCQSAGGDGQDAWTADNDTPRLDERLIRLGLIWRWKQAKGFDYAQAFDDYEAALAQAIGRDGPRRTLSFACDGTERRPGIAVPQGNWTL